MTSEKVEGLKCIRFEKLTAQFWLTKGPIGVNIFIWGKEIQIWMVKDAIRILKGLIDCKENKFLDSIWVLIGRNWSLGIGIRL
jgi:hypothetical protein